MIRGEDRTIYFSGDTDVMADMGIFEELHHPEIGILCAGGHFTMDMERAASPPAASSTSGPSSPATIAPSRCSSSPPRSCGPGSPAST
jgi:hypothetical protein